MSLPFTADQFFDIFRQYNTSIWPAQLLLVALAVCAAVLALRPNGRSGHLVAVYLAAQWCWTGVVYHWWFFSRINPAASLFGAIWVAGAIAFAASSGGSRRLSFRTRLGWRVAVGASLVTYALVLYPLLGLLDGRIYPLAPTFGAPCPVAIYTFGLLWLADRRAPAWLVIAPLAWAAIGSSAAFTLGVYEDLGLLAAGISGLVLLLLRHSPGPASHAPAISR